VRLPFRTDWRRRSYHDPEVVFVEDDTYPLTARAWRKANATLRVIAWQRERDWDSVRERCHELARRARNELGLERLTPDSEEFFRQMVTLRLPEDVPEDLQERLYDEHRIEVPVFERGEERFIRLTFQGYNDASDLGRLRYALDDLLAE
jgi:broad specificity phosphatase PhoE